MGVSLNKFKIPSGFQLILAHIKRVFTLFKTTMDYEKYKMEFQWNSA